MLETSEYVFWGWNVSKNPQL